MVQEYEEHLQRFRKDHHGRDPSYISAEEYHKRITTITQMINSLILASPKDETYVHGAIIFGSYGHGINEASKTPLVHDLSDLDIYLLVTEDSESSYITEEKFLDDLSKQLENEGFEIPIRDGVNIILYSDHDDIKTHLWENGGLLKDKFILITPYSDVSQTFRQHLEELRPMEQNFEF